MKSIKKRFKLLLSDIVVSANQLAVISADLTLLSEIQQLAAKVLRADATLSLLISALKKDDFVIGVADSQALAELEEMIDVDAVSSLEERLFAALNNQDDHGVGEFLQQFLGKIDKTYTKMLTDIQLLTALLDQQED
jgi:hypothetical protein